MEQLQFYENLAAEEYAPKVWGDAVRNLVREIYSLREACQSSLEILRELHRRDWQRVPIRPIDILSSALNDPLRAEVVHADREHRREFLKKLATEMVQVARAVPDESLIPGVISGILTTLVSIDDRAL